MAALAHEGTQAYVFVRTKEGFEARPVIVVTRAQACITFADKNTVKAELVAK